MKYYSISNMLSTNARYMILLGQRANGKSYQAKLTVLNDYVQSGERFIYLRRRLEDIKTAAVEEYFGDMPISKITKGEYNGIKAWQNRIYLTYTDSEGKVTKKDQCGYYCALNVAERYKSWSFPKVYNMVYEEFITDGAYLIDEPTMLQQFVSTVFRHRTGRVIMVGNTLSRVCPYFNEWALEGTLKQKQGTIEVYHYKDFDGEIVDIAVEYCANANISNSMFFGQAGKQIVTGEWEVKCANRLPKPIEEYENVYEVLLIYQKFKFVLQLLVEPNDGGKLIFVYPFTGSRKFDRIIQDEFSDLPNITRKLDISRRPEAYIRNCLVLDKVCYSDNLTASDFNHVRADFKFIG